VRSRQHPKLRAYLSKLVLARAAVTVDGRGDLAAVSPPGTCRMTATASRIFLIGQSRSTESRVVGGRGRAFAGRGALMPPAEAITQSSIAVQTVGPRRSTRYADIPPPSLDSCPTPGKSFTTRKAVLSPSQRRAQKAAPLHVHRAVGEHRCIELRIAHPSTTPGATRKAPTRAAWSPPARSPTRAATRVEQSRDAEAHVPSDPHESRTDPRPASLR